MNISIRKAQRKDSQDILRLINELAEFEKLQPPDKDANNRLIKHAFGKNPLFDLLIAKIGKKTVGYALYFFTYSSFLARKSLYLEDIYVSRETRNIGAGALLFKELVKIAGNNKCGRIEWCVLRWNKKAINFYKKFGAKELKEWKYYRISL
jgi:ribosomal protein S18 acetylase RimI-like enzyme